jgi:cytochrome c5
MKRISGYAVVLMFLGAALLSARGVEGSELDKGKTIYQSKCQICHGEHGMGDGPMSRTFNPKPSNFTKPEFWKNKPEEKIMDAVENGYMEMPPLDLTADEAKAVIDYISHTFKPEQHSK